jgi:hypothetical protein
MLFLKAAGITISLEMLLALALCRGLRIPIKILYSVLLGNMISLPIVWFVFPLLNNFSAVVIASELFAFIFEAYVIYWFNRKVIVFKTALILSFVLNSSSFLAGELIYYFFPAILK